MFNKIQLLFLFVPNISHADITEVNRYTSMLKLHYSSELLLVLLPGFPCWLLPLPSLFLAFYVVLIPPQNLFKTSRKRSRINQSKLCLRDTDWFSQTKVCLRSQEKNNTCKYSSKTPLHICSFTVPHNSASNNITYLQQHILFPYLNYIF